MKRGKTMIVAWIFLGAATAIAQTKPSPGPGMRVAQEARRWIGGNVANDCVGFVRFVLTRLGYRFPQEAFQPGSANASQSLYQGTRAQGWLREGDPKRGDIIFFRETYDVNRDGLRNDGVTHVGIVSRVAPDGTVSFVHRERKGITEGRANPLRPKDAKDERGRTLNVFIRRESQVHRGYLAGELIAGYLSPGWLPREKPALRK